MFTYICENCKAVFEEPIKGYEEEPDRCPNCGDWAFRVARKCRICGEPCVEDICDGCLEEFHKALDGFIELYSKTLGIPRTDIEELIEDYI